MTRVKSRKSLRRIRGEFIFGLFEKKASLKKAK
jgi:hypothetical protein